MMDYDKQVDGNLAALSKYLGEIDRTDEAFQYIKDDYDKAVKKVVFDFSSAMDDFISIKEEISSALDQAGLDNGEDSVIEVLTDIEDEVIIEQIDGIDW